MDEKEFERLLTITQTEALSIESYMCLKEDSVDGPYGQWGWSKSMKNISDHFAYVFVLGTIIQFNESKGVNKISSEFVMTLINDDVNLNKVSSIEKTFFDLWKQTCGVEDFYTLKKTSKRLCKYLNSLGYVLNFILYKNPKKALSKALELDRYLPHGEMGFGEFLRANLNDEYE